MKNIRLNFIFFMLITSIGMLGFSKPGYHIVGNVSAPDGTLFKLSYRYGERIIADSGRVINNTFSLKGEFPEPVICTLSNSVNQQIKIFVAENTVIDILGSVEQFVYSKLTSGNEDRLYNQFLNKSKVVSGRYLSMLGQSGEAARDTNTSAFKVFRNRKDSLIRTFVKDYSNSTAASLAIIYSYVTNPDRGRAAIAFKLLSAKGKQTIYAKRIKQFIDAEKVIAPGRLAPDFTLRDINGKSVKLSDYKGKYILLDFWASWCAPCRQEHPLMKDLYKRYGADKVTFLSVSMDASIISWKHAVATDGLSWIQLNDGESLNGRLADTYGIKSVPFNCIIDPSGVIIATKLRGQELSGFINKLFN